MMFISSFKKTFIIAILSLSCFYVHSQPLSHQKHSVLAQTTTSASCRDRFLWPFSATSIWNTAIGSDAIYLDAGIYPAETGALGPPNGIHNDQDWLIKTTSNDPYVNWIDDSGNFPGLCTANGPVHAQIPFPTNFSTDCVANNNGAGVLLPDNVTLVQMQPLYVPKPGGPIIAWWHTGAPQPFPWNVSILGDGALGAHGGSGLSSFGGTLRSGELSAASLPIAHALKLELWAHAYYFFNWTTRNYSSCFTWPAVGCDSYWDHTGSGYNGTNPFLKPGALLAVPPTRAPTVFTQLVTIPGRRILQALTDYGGYIVDDTGSQVGGGALCAERQVSVELEAEYGFSWFIEKPLTSSQGIPLYNDLVAIFRALSIVVNNDAEHIGGGGIPRQPPPPPIC